MSGAWVEPSSGMLGDEIMPVSRLDDEVEKRAKIARASKIKTGAKRIWQYIHPYYSWVETQQQKPLEHNVPEGQCLDENSLCDVGHDDQCCGFASYCVDYWGIGKCLAYKKPEIYDKVIPERIHRNNLYKAYMRKLENAAMVKW